MEICDFKKELINSSPKNKIKKKSTLNNDVVLCNHCKRTASNGIRCLGICVADNDY